MKALDVPGNPVCIVYWPEPPCDVWGGLCGSAKVYKGEPMAVLSSGEKVPL